MYEFVDKSKEMAFRIFVITKVTLAGAPFLSIQNDVYAKITKITDGEIKSFDKNYL
jgi:hypothetical protein